MRRQLLPAAFVLLSAVACSFDEQVIRVSQPQIVVHAVLDPDATLQEILVERTLTGAVTVREDVRYDPLDPINTSEGDPVAGADVVIQGPDGIIRAVERRYSGKPTTYGAGRYEVVAGRTRATPIRPGGRYTLTVRTLSGVVVTGSTIVPAAPAPVNTGGFLPFDRDVDTVRLNWKPVVGARTYGLRVETPFGPFLFFSDSTTLKLGGNLRNLFASDLQRVFIPGFRQAITVFAVDTNFFDYYRSRNDPFTGSGIINKLAGGIGLFGAVGTLDTRTLEVTQSKSREPAIEGVWERLPGLPIAGVVDTFTLFVETEGPPTSLSGWYKGALADNPRDGVAGARDGSRIELAFLIDQDSRRRRATFIGVQRGDSLIGSLNIASGTVVFRKKR